MEEPENRELRDLLDDFEDNDEPENWMCPLLPVRGSEDALSVRWIGLSNFIVKQSKIY